MLTNQRSRLTSHLLSFIAIVVLSLWAANRHFAAAAEASATATEGNDQKDQKTDAKADEKKSESAADKKEAPPSDKAAAEKKEDTAKADAKEKEKGKPAAPTADSNGTAKVKTEAESSKKAPDTPKRDKVRLALFTLSDSLPESIGEMGPFGETRLDLREAISRLEKAAKDKSISGVVFDIENPEIGRGKVDELRAAITRFRESGKKTYAMLETAMPSDYLIACACDEIVMPETGIVMLPGIHVEATFYKGLLAKLGIEADFIHMGAYKGAAEPLTNDKFSEPVRENMTSLVDTLYDNLVTTIVKTRPLSIAQAKEVIDTGLITAKRAKELGLIDRVAYSDTLRKELAESYSAEPLVYVQNYGQKEVDADFSGPMGFLKLMQVMMGGSQSSGEKKGKKIAVVYAVGPIVSGKSEGSMFGGQTMGSTTIVDALREANDDKDVVAIVLRIDSPGGSAIASDMIWRETQVIKKPIVASMGDVAASGGYYIAMGADKIFAAPSTITGSIGVVGGKLATRGLYEKLGITTETIERGKNSGLFSSSGKFTDSQREVIKNMMEDTYGQFTSKAAEGRHMPVEKLRELAGGRVYSGRQAKDIGLVDELGTLHDAIADAKQLAGLEKGAEVRIKVLPAPTNFFEQLFGDMAAEKEVRVSKELEVVAPEMVELARRAYRLRAVFDQPAALVMPFELNVR